MLTKLKKLADKLPTKTKVIILVLTDFAILFFSLILSFSLRFSQIMGPAELPSIIWLLVLINIGILMFFSVYNFVASIFSKKLEKNIIYSQVVVIMAWGSALLILGQQGVPRSVLFIYFALSTLMLAGWRRFIAHVLSSPAPKKAQKPREKILIYGADKDGAMLSERLLEDGQLHPVAFIDDNPRYVGRRVAGLKVFGAWDLPKLLKQLEIGAVILNNKGLNHSKKMALVKEAKKYGAEVRLVPDMKTIAEGRVSISELRPIKLEDLLKRPQIPPKKELLHAAVKNKVVLVTGAGGSIGSELVRQVVNIGPKEIILLENSELNLFNIRLEIEARFREMKTPPKMHAFLGSVTDGTRLQQIFSRFNVDIVFHAAAYKHVFLTEENPGEAIRNNVLGTFRVAQAAKDAGVHRFVLISTDKAVRPKGIMGASKRMAELIIQGLDRQPGKTIFTAVRFGNVLGSSGSVVPLFQEQIAHGGPVTVTHREVTRYFMLISEAAQLVIQAAAMAKGGEVFLLKMGEPVRILDLARTMVYLSGLTPWIRGEDEEGDIEIVFTGLKPGEKLHEELFEGNNIAQTRHDQILRCHERSLSWPRIKAILDELEDLLQEGRESEARKLVEEAIASEEEDIWHVPSIPAQ